MEEELIEVVMVSRRQKMKLGDVVRVVWLDDNTPEDMKHYFNKVGIVSGVYNKGQDVDVEFYDDVPFATFYPAELEIIPDDKVEDIKILERALEARNWW